METNNIRAIITGTTGMVGKGVLLQCLSNPAITEVLVINRSTVNISHPKLKEILHKDFFDLSAIEDQLSGYNACYFCLGVSSFRMKETDYHRLTYELTTYMAQTLLKLNPGLSFCYVSGHGTDSTEKGRSMWARVKGKTENALLAMPFSSAYMFRPGFIQPMDGITSRTPLYHTLLVIFNPIFPLLKKLMPQSITTTRVMGKAMISVTLHGYEKHILNPPDINLAASRII